MKELDKILEGLAATRDEYAAHPYATIYTHTAARGYTSDTLPLFTYSDIPPADVDRRARYIKPGRGIRGMVLFDAEEVRAALAKKAKRCREKKVNEYTRAISAAPAVYAHYSAALNAAEKVLESEAGSGSPLYYAIREER